MKHLILFFTALLIFSTSAFSQNVGIDTENPDAKLDVVSSNSGILIPRIELSGTNDVTTVPAATASELIYNTVSAGSGSTAVTPGFYYWSGSNWVRIKVGSEGEDDDWYENGGTAPDNINDNIYTQGNVSIGIGTAVERLHVAGNIRVDGDTIMTEDNLATQFVILSNGGVVVKLDNNDDGTGEEFSIKRSGPDLNSKVFKVTEAGNTDADGHGKFGGEGEFNGDLTILGDGRDQIVGENFDFVGDGSFDFFLDADSDNAGATFVIKNDSGNNLLAIAENSHLTLYPYGTNTGETGGLRLRELSGSDYVEIQAPDVLGSSYVFTWPSTDGLANQVLQTDGFGVLSWETATIGTVVSVTAGTAMANSGTPTDPILDVVTDGATIGVNGSNELEIIDLPDSDDDYIWNQNAVAQSGANFRIEEDGTMRDMNITGGDIYGPGINYGSNSLLRIHSRTDFRVLLDNDDNGNESFQIHRNGSSAIADRVFEVFENGIVETDGSYGMLESGASPLYFTRLQSGDLAGSHLTFTLPPNAGNNGEVLQTNGSGILTWTDGSGLEDHDFYEVGGTVSPDNINDDIYTEGSVGIGTATPDYELDVDGDIGIGTGSAGTLFRNTDNNTAIKFTNDRIQMWAGSSTSSAGMIDIQASVSEVAINENSLNWNLRVEGGTDVNLLVTDAADNRVGIGTNSPNQKLEVSGNARITDLAGTNSRLVLANPDGDLLTIDNGTADQVLVSDGSILSWESATVLDDDDWHEVGTSSAPTDINANIFTFGNVGIGINSPGAPLEVQANGLGNPFSNGIYVYNSNADAANRDAIITARTQRNNTGGDAGGDPFFVVDAVTDGGWSFGMDNDHENRFKISNDPTDLSTATKMTLKTNGHVGIGTTDPLLQLHLNFAGRNGILIDGDGTGDPLIQLENNFGSSHYIYSDQSDGNGFEFESGNDIVFNTNGDNERMVIESGGDVGIGITDPLVKLDIGGTTALNDNQLRLRTGTDANHHIVYVGGAIDGPAIQGNKHTVIRSATRDLAWFIDYNSGTNDWPGIYAGSAYAGGQTGGSFGEAARLVRGRNGDGTLEFLNNGWGRIGGSNGLAFWANGNADGDDSPAMVLLNNGRLGIGTNAPKASVEVNSWVNFNIASYGYLNAAGNTGTGGGSNNYSIYANQRIAASEFNAHSDERIKAIKGISNSKEDLRSIMEIEITNYSMIDSKMDDGSYKKVIAQQVKEVYPQSVSYVTEVVPDIYQLAEINDGRIEIPNNLNVEDKVRLIFDDGPVIAKVIASDELGFSVSSQQQGKVFVYGREVDDFHVVDYEAIGMLNVSATQEQQRLIDALNVEIEELKNENVLLKSVTSEQETRLRAIEVRLNSGLEVNR